MKDFLTWYLDSRYAETLTDEQFNKAVKGYDEYLRILQGK